MNPPPSRSPHEIVDYLRQSHVFLHDDCWPHYEGDQDELSQHPLIIGSEAVACSPLLGYGEETLEALDAIGFNCAPKYLCPAGANSPTEAILANAPLADSLAEGLKGRRLSIFYPDASRSVELIESLVSRSQVEAHQLPSPHEFQRCSDRTVTDGYLRRIGAGTIEATTSDSLAEISSFRSAVGGEVVLKCHHHPTVVAASDKDVASYLRSVCETGLTSPIRAEKRHSVISSPVVAILIDDLGNASLLYVAEQLFDKGCNHVGNVFSSEFDTNGRYDDCLKLAQLIAEDNPSMRSGVVGLDLIRLADGRQFIIDVNARFNSSTFPALFVQSAFDEVPYSAIYKKYVSRGIKSLDEVFERCSFEMMSSGYGTLLFSPRSINGELSHFYGVSVGCDAQRALEQADQILQASSRDC